MSHQKDPRLGSKQGDCVLSGSLRDIPRYSCSVANHANAIATSLLRTLILFLFLLLCSTRTIMPKGSGHDSGHGKKKGEFPNLGLLLSWTSLD
jgi:hypothetical protein